MMTPAELNACREDLKRGIPQVNFRTWCEKLLAYSDELSAELESVAAAFDGGADDDVVIVEETDQDDPDPGAEDDD